MEIVIAYFLKSGRFANSTKIGGIRYVIPSAFAD